MMKYLLTIAATALMSSLLTVAFLEKTKTPEIPLADTDSFKYQISRAHARDTCGLYIVGEIENKAEDKAKVIAKLIEIDGFAFTHNNIYCKAIVESATLFDNNRMTSPSSKEYHYKLYDPRKLEIAMLEKRHIDEAYQRYLTGE